MRERLITAVTAILLTCAVYAALAAPGQNQPPEPPNTPREIGRYQVIVCPLYGDGGLCLLDTSNGEMWGLRKGGGRMAWSKLLLDPIAAIRDTRTLFHDPAIIRAPPLRDELRRTADGGAELVPRSSGGYPRYIKTGYMAEKLEAISRPETIWKIPGDGSPFAARNEFGSNVVIIYEQKSADKPYVPIGVEPVEREIVK